MEYDAEGNFVSYVTVNIEDVKVGDLVYSYNTLTGEVEQREVTQTLAKTSDHINYLTIVDEHGIEQTIETTDVHPFWVVTDSPDLSRAARSFADGMYHENLEGNEHGYYVEAKDLRVGDVFLGANGELSTLVATERVAGGIAVFNFRVDGNHNYYILTKEYEYGQTCVLVHNAEWCWYDDWGAGSNFTPEMNAEKHFFDHADDFPDIEEVEEYARLAALARDKAILQFEWKDGIDVKGDTPNVKRFKLKDGFYVDLEQAFGFAKPLIISFGKWK